MNNITTQGVKQNKMSHKIKITLKRLIFLISTQNI